MMSVCPGTVPGTEGSVTMEIRITRTTEYVIDIDDSDTAALGHLDRILGAPDGVEGDHLDQRVIELHSTDPQELLAVLCRASFAEIADDSYTVDDYDVDGLAYPWAPADANSEEEDARAWA